MTDGLPLREILLALLLVGAGLHGLALTAARRGARTAPRAAAALAQAALLAALAPAGLLGLVYNEPTSWLPARTNQLLFLALALALLLFLIAGAWWRSPGLGVTLPLLLAGLAIVTWLLRDPATARGLALSGQLRSVFAGLSAVALATASLAVAALLARWLEAATLGRPRLSPWAAPALLGSAALLRTAQVGLGVVGWLQRPRTQPDWSLAQTWLLATWLVLLLASLALWRREAVAPPLAVLALLLLLVNLTYLAGLPTPP